MAGVPNSKRKDRSDYVGRAVPAIGEVTLADKMNLRRPPAFKKTGLWVF